MTRYRTPILVSAALAGLAWAAGCGDGATEPPTPPPDPPRPAAVTVSPATAELTALGATVQLTAEVRDQNGQAMAGAAVTWARSSAAVATVSSAGLVTAAGDGTATITATAGSVSGTAMVTVAQEVSTVAVSPAVDTLVTGNTLRLAAEASDANGHAVPGAEFSWASNDTLVAVVDAAGLVTGVRAGAVEVTATAARITGRAELTIIAPVPTTVTVTPDTVALTALGQTAQFAWSTTDTTVASVDSTGVVTAVGSGATAITATAGEATGDALVKVMQSAVSVVVSPPADTIAPGDTLRLAAEAFDENGHVVAGAEFTWSSGDTLVAVVDGTGLVTGVGVGEVVIIATSSEVTGSAALVVTAAPRWTLSGAVSHGWTDPDLQTTRRGGARQQARTVRGLGTLTPAVTTPAGRVIGAVVEIVDGPDAGRQAATDDGGRYVLEAVQQTQVTIRAMAEGFASVSRVVDLTSDMALDLAISHEVPPQQAPSPFPDTDPEWLRALSSDYPHAHQVANVRVFSDISATFSKDHAEHLKRVWDFFDALYVGSRGTHVDAYYTTNPVVFQKVVPHCPTTFIPGARNVTACYPDYPRWFIMPYQIPDFGTQLHEIGHDFLFATWPLWDDYKWFIEGTAMYFEGGVFKDDGSLRVSAPLPYCTILFQRLDQEARLMSLVQLLRLKAAAFQADNERTYSQSCMLFNYLERREPGVLYGLIRRINSGQVSTNDDLVTALLELTGKSVSELEQAYQAYARYESNPQ